MAAHRRALIDDALDFHPAVMRLDEAVDEGNPGDKRSIGFLAVRLLIARCRPEVRVPKLLSVFVLTL